MTEFCSGCGHSEGWHQPELRGVDTCNPAKTGGCELCDDCDVFWQQPELTPERPSVNFVIPKEFHG